MARELRQRVIAITGASSGIGAATAVACAQAGMQVMLAARRQERLELVAQQITAAGGTAAVCVCDVRRPEDVEKLLAQVEQRFGRLDAFFANAGYGFFCPTASAPEELMRDLFETNFWGTLRCVRAALPLIRRTRERRDPPGFGHLLICSSVLSEVSLPMYGLYCATKAAQDSITGSLRAELAHEGIAVSSVHPSGTRTDFWQVVRQCSPLPASPEVINTPDFLLQSPEHVARRVLACLRRPRPEVWPSPLTRYGAALATAFPGFTALALRQIMRYRSRRVKR